MNQRAIKTILACVTVATSIGVSGVVAQERPIIVIDAGHGGDEIGVQHGEILEKDVILRLAFNVAAEVVRHGYDVRLTRTGDYPVAWDDRRAIAEEAGADLLVMLHAMGKEDPAIHGAEIYYYEEDANSTRAAHLAASAMTADGTAVSVLPRPWPFLQSAAVPTVMIELGHLSNPLELRSILSDDYHRALAHMLMDVAGDLASDR